MNLVPKSLKTQHAIALRRFHQIGARQESDLAGKTFLKGEKFEVGVTEDMTTIFLMMYSDDDQVIAVELNRKALKKLKSDFEFMAKVISQPSLWNRGHISGSDAFNMEGSSRP